MSGVSPDRMSDVFNTLPGIEASVSSVSKSLRDMWAGVAASGKTALPPDEVKATQLNLVLHLGLPTKPDDAITQFQVALRFAQRYPCRVVVLCPLPENSSLTEIHAKVYGECFFGKSKGDTRCVEAVMLSYPVSARPYLENQVSVCLSTDLPLYYWVHRFSDAGKLSAYQYLLCRSKRVIFDTAIVPPDALAYSWPQPEAVRDLAFARLLHVRQVIGQFLSGDCSLGAGKGPAIDLARPRARVSGRSLQSESMACRPLGRLWFECRGSVASTEDHTIGSVGFSFCFLCLR